MVAEHAVNGERARTTHVVVAGPSSQVTLPGVMTAEVVGLLAPFAKVTTIAVDSTKDFASGLHRAPALAGAYQRSHHVVNSLRAPLVARHRRAAMRPHFGERTSMAVALAWPGLDNSWIGDFVRLARESRTPSVVLVVTHPNSPSHVAALAREVSDCDVVLVGDIMEASLLAATLGTTRPIIEVQRALSLNGRAQARPIQTVSTFLQRDDVESLQSVLRAFDATPEGWIDGRQLRVVMRYHGSEPEHLVRQSFHGAHVELIGETLDESELAELAQSSSAFAIGDPEIDSRVFSQAMNQGIGTAVLSDGVPLLSTNYVGAVLGNVTRPASIHVAVAHTLRMADLRFPGPQDWREVAQRLDSICQGRLESPLNDSDSDSAYR